MVPECIPDGAPPHPTRGAPEVAGSIGSLVSRSRPSADRPASCAALRSAGGAASRGFRAAGSEGTNGRRAAPSPPVRRSRRAGRRGGAALPEESRRRVAKARDRACGARARTGGRPPGTLRPSRARSAGCRGTGRPERHPVSGTERLFGRGTGPELRDRRDRSRRRARRRCRRWPPPREPGASSRSRSSGASCRGRSAGAAASPCCRRSPKRRC